MLYRKSDAKNFSIPGGTTGVLYPPSPNSDQSIARIQVDGVYPKKGHSINEICTETLYVLSGPLEIEYHNQWFKLNERDVFVILPFHKYRTKGKGEAFVFITPSWDPKQNHIV